MPLTQKQGVEDTRFFAEHIFPIALPVSCSCICISVSLLTLISWIPLLREGMNPLREGAIHFAHSWAEVQGYRTSSVSRFNTQDFSCHRSTRTLWFGLPRRSPCMGRFQTTFARGGHTSRAFSPVSLSSYRVRGRYPPLSLSVRVVS